MADPITPTGSSSPLTGLVFATPGAALPVATGLPANAEGTQTSKGSANESAKRAAIRAGQEGERNGKNPLSLEEAEKTLRDYLKNLPSDLQFWKDAETGYLAFKIVNPLTKEVIRQFPAEEVLAMARKLKQASEALEEPGILLDREF